MKRLICILCAVFLVVTVFGTVTVSAESSKLTQPWSDGFVADLWDGNTDNFDANRFFASKNKETATVTSKQAFDVSDGFTLSSFLIMDSGYGNYYGEYCSMSVGNIELRICNIKSEKNYYCSIMCGDTRLATYQLGDNPDHAYSLAYKDGYASLYIDNAPVSLDTDDGTASDKVSANGNESIDNANIRFSITNNYASLGRRRFERCVLRPGISQYSGKDVYFTLSDNGHEKNGAYFVAPNTYSIYTGDRIKFSYSTYYTKFYWADGTIGSMSGSITAKEVGDYYFKSQEFIVKTNDSYPDNYFLFTVPGTYTFRFASKADTELITVEVVDQFYAIDIPAPVIENDDVLYPASGHKAVPEIPTGDDVVQIYPNVPGVFFSSDIWVSVPLVSAELRELGFEGGESCQAVASMVCDPVTGQLCFMGTDCGGFERSLDGGAHWEQVTIGLDAGGATGTMVDGNNIDHVITVGCDTSYRQGNGLYVTDNATGQCEWTKVLSLSQMGGDIGTHNDYRIQIAIDETTFDQSIGCSAVAYWSRENYIDEDADKTAQNNRPALWKSVDGGYSWTRIDSISVSYDNGATFTDYSDSSMFGGANIFVNQSNGWLYVQTRSGLFVSKDGGHTFVEKLTRIYSNTVPLCATFTRAEGYEGYVYVTSSDGMFLSKDYGETWTQMFGSRWPTQNPVAISVSPVNPDNIYVTNRVSGGGGFYSNNGGISWNMSQKLTLGKWEPATSGSPFGFWSPVYANTLIVSASGIFKSIDAGATLHYSGAGVDNICPGGQFNANVNHPDLIAIASQDYNGGFSRDGGHTWTYLSWEGKGWGGFTYGAYILDENTITVCNSDSWTGDRYLWVTHDGGQTYVDTGILVTGRTIGMGALGNDSIAFMGEWRTVDRGYTWKQMSSSAITGSVGCSAVFAVDFNSGRLFGSLGPRIVTSVDNGLTWTVLGNAPSTPGDMDYDPVTGELYAVCSNKLYKSHIDWTSQDNEFSAVDFDKPYVSQVSVDHSSPNVIYVACSSNSHYYIDGLMRSLDYGKTWTCLTRKVGDGRDNCPDYGRQITSMTINPITGELLATSGCRGLCKISAPPKWYSNSVALPDVRANTWESEPTDSPISDQVISDIDSYQRNNPGKYYGYKTVYLDYDAQNRVEDRYFSVPDGTVIHTGDHVKLNFHSVAVNFTFHDGTQGKLYNVTYYKGNWSYSKQTDLDHNGYFVFDVPGTYSLYSTDKGTKLCTFTVESREGDINFISSADQLYRMDDQPNGIYVLIDDIDATGFETVCQAGNPFFGVLYGNGHSITGLSSPIFGENRGVVARLMVDCNITDNAVGAICNENYGLIEYCKVSGSITGTANGGITSMNRHTVKDCLTDAYITGDNCGAVCSENIVTDGVYANIVNCVCNADKADSYSSEDGVDGATVTWFTAAQLAESGASIIGQQWYTENGVVLIRSAEMLTSHKLDSTKYDIFDGVIRIDSQPITVGQFKSNMYDGQYITVYDNFGDTVSDSEIIRSEYTVTLSIYGEVYDIATVAYFGNPSGERFFGVVNYHQVKAYIVGIGHLSDAFKVSYDINSDRVLDTADLLLMKQHLIGIADIFEN